MKRDGSVVHRFKRERKGVKRCEVCRWKPPVGLSALHDDASTMLHAHHVIPLACGGPDSAANLVLVCPTHHALSHKLGAMKSVPPRIRPVWTGPQTREQLLRELRMLEKEPSAFIAYIEAGRDYAALEAADAEQEVQRRRGAIRVIHVTKSVTREPRRIFNAS